MAAAQDVAMAAKDQAPKPSEEKPLALSDLKPTFGLLERAVQNLDVRFTLRALRGVASIRRHLHPGIIRDAVQAVFPPDNPVHKAVAEMFEGSSMEEDHNGEQGHTVPEVQVFASLLALIYLSDQKDASKGMVLADEVVAFVRSLNRRTLDPILSRVYFYFARFYELNDKLDQIRPVLLAAQKTAALRRDDETQAMLINLLLRSYLHYNLHEQAQKLASKSSFPENVGNNQVARYMYYLGRIEAVQLDYTNSYSHLQQALRKAPQTHASQGFQLIVTKLSVIVNLLMGEIPARSIFKQKPMRKALAPYLHIAQAVRVGDLAMFQEGLAQHADVYKSDSNFTLILRLRHNVIKAGIRMISLSYSRISLRDICMKLHLDSEADAEYIVAKAIRDGVIDATIDHENGYIQSRENADVYSTTEPQNAFHQRVLFCLDLHNESVKALRFPEGAHRKELASADAARERERELAKEIAEADDLEDDMSDF